MRCFSKQTSLSASRWRCVNRRQSNRNPKRQKSRARQNEYLYQCQNCNARVGCHKGTTRPLGDVANEILRLKRIEAHQVFDAYWQKMHISRTKAYQWLARELKLSEEETHIGGFEIDTCQRVIDLCRAKMDKK